MLSTNFVRVRGNLIESSWWVNDFRSFEIVLMEGRGQGVGDGDQKMGVRERRGKDGKT